MSARRPTRPSARLLLGVATALVLPASLLAWTQPGSAAGSAPAAGPSAADEVPASVSVRTTSHQRIRLEALPQHFEVVKADAQQVKDFIAAHTGA